MLSITDANGTPITDANHIANRNPFRYRGYYYDTETGLYYLQSRYYNPEWGRFLNADELISTGQGMLCHNMYAYCGNNPINREDPTGELFGIIKMITSLVNSVVNITRNIRVDAETTTGYTERINACVAKTTIKTTKTISKTKSKSSNTTVFVKNTDGKKHSIGIEHNNKDKTISIEKSLTSTSICYSNEKQSIQYENEYIYINNISFVNYATYKNITNSTYYTLTINQLAIDVIFASVLVPEILPFSIGVIEYAN